MGATALLPAVQVVLNSLIPLVTEQIKLAWDSKGDLQKLQRRLNNIQALLRDAEKGQTESEALKEWLKCLKSVTCDVENVLGEFAYEALRRKLEVGNRMRYKVHNFFSLSNPLAFRLKMANRVKNINLVLDEICKEAHDIGLRPADQLMSASVLPSERRPTTPFVDESRCVGRDGDVEVIREMLLGSKDDLSVIAIVGMPGLGKTTLAQLVYHDKKVVELFGNNKMWICVSDDFRVERLLNEMVQYLYGSESNILNTGAIVKKLGEKLKGKVFLLVLDDVWNTIPQMWEDLISSLKAIGGSNKCKIMVTTRSVDVVSALRVPQPLIHPLHELSANDSWTMFRKKAFAIGGPRETESLVDLGRKMVEKCKGVPLAINSLGGLLFDKKSLTEWESIEESEIWRGEGEILPALRLSFHHLPFPSLKQCFAYCSIFPKEHLLKKDVLIQLWMSLGYLQSLPRKKMEMEDMGNEYFDILLRNSLLQDVRMDVNKDIIACKMHDLVHDLALDVSGGSCLTLKASEIKDHPQVQHLSVSLKEEKRLEISDVNIGKLRTLFLSGNLPKNTENLKSIRALSIVNSGVQALSSSICKCIHLKYLDLSKSSFRKVPNSITKLYNLETLRLPPSSNILEDIQSEFHKLVSLRHLYVQNTENNRKMIPKMMGRLTSLQTLPFFSVGKDSGHKIEELGSLSKLHGKLIVYDLQNVKDCEEAKGANMSHKPKITGLEFHWDFMNIGKSHTKCDDVLEGLKPHKNLRHLMVKGFEGQRLASWIRCRDDQSLRNLVKIELISCISCRDIPVLGHLPHLEVVEMAQLNNVESIGPEFYGLDEQIVAGRISIEAATAVFPALRKLTIRSMLKLKEWSDVFSLPHATSREFFPHLEELDISDCPNLITIPGNLLRIQQLGIMSDPISVFTRSYRPSSTILVSRNVKKVSTLIENLLEKSSKFIRELVIAFSDLDYLPKQLLNLASLELLKILGCPNLRYIREEEGAEFHRCLPFLQELSITGCGELTCLPKGLLQPTLVRLEICWCYNLTEASPEELRNLTSLRELNLHKLGWERCWEEGQFCLTSLRKLYIGPFSEEFDYFPWPEVEMVKAQNPGRYPFMYLESLVIWGWPKIKSLPDQLQHLTSLRTLDIYEFKGLEALPEWLGNLSSLELLKLFGCYNLMRLPSLENFQLLKNLESLVMIQSPLITERCKEGDQEWCKIASIPSLKVYSDG